ncbi:MULTISPECIES: peptidoglycan editing factor PgeF [Vitreoscilla]|uniref:Purine nucleoside phosphorylase n=1 Tax=Vitreoscilla stercoraria TaxID=61 RepID=A0ABY4EE86_VITST|nr:MULTISPECIES: peptidoglycan editing factor PgeF [Vitreoscilla]AUZ04557.1 laccase domain-containing protein YfiH [Vitreoscilla sp. C1]UOO91737.1 peptidoglycan editing factor PgeF [Vitreoscilla stercoraria]
MKNLAITRLSESVFTANWPAPANVKTLISTRHGGVSEGVYASLNVGAHVGDVAEHVAQNRALVQQHASMPLAYLNQTHSTDVVEAEAALQDLLDADASVNCNGQAACAVMTADCLPVLLCDAAGTVVAAAHAGWRGLVGGVIENTVAAMNVTGRLLAYLGPAIGADAFEVGEEVRAAFVAHDAQAAKAFVDIGDGKYLADIYLLARQRLQALGILDIYGGEHCTVLQREDFFSYRRDGQTGRMVSAIWLEA